MTAPDSLPLHALAEENLAAASPDLLRAMIKTFADALMSAEADAVCGAEYGQVSDERVNRRNGYRPCAGAVEVIAVLVAAYAGDSARPVSRGQSHEQGSQGRQPSDVPVRQPYDVVHGRSS